MPQLPVAESYVLLSTLPGYAQLAARSLRKDLAAALSAAERRAVCEAVLARGDALAVPLFVLFEVFFSYTF